MISATGAFVAANAKLNKKPVYVVNIRGYGRAFSTAITGTLGTWLGLGGLCGCFTDGTGQIIGQPFAIGGSVVSLKVPAGATQLQLGIDDDILSDNSGGFTVPVNGSNIFVTATAAAWDWVGGGLNAAFQFGIQDGTAPVVVSGLTAGQLVNIGPATGTMAWGGIIGGGTPPDGNLGIGTQGNGLSSHPFPGFYLTTAIYPWLTDISPLKITVSDLDGSADLADLQFSVQDLLQLLTADLADFVLEGKQVTLLAGFAGMAVGDYLPMFTGVINAVDSDNNNLDYKFTATDLHLKKLTQKIYTVGDSGSATDSKNPKTLNGHPLDILVDALTQAGVPSVSIDTAKIYYYRDTIYNGLPYKFNLTSAPTAKDFIENELMKPLGMYLWPNNLGTLSINSFYPALSGNDSYTPPVQPCMDVAVSINPLQVQQNNAPLAQEAPLINQCAFKFEDDGTGSQKFLAEEIAQWDLSVNKYGLKDAHTIESQGMRSAFQGYFMAAIISRLIFLRYGQKNLIMDPTSLDWKACVLEPGDIISLDNPFVPDRAAGVLGVTAQTFEVMDREWDFMAGIVDLKLLAIDLSKFKQYLITPDVEGPFAFASAGDQAKYLFQSNDSDQYSTGVPANTLG